MADLDKLDEYLRSEDSPEDSMALSDLDGFLHRVACTPEPIDDSLGRPKTLFGNCRAAAF